VPWPLSQGNVPAPIAVDPTGAGSGDGGRRTYDVTGLQYLQRQNARN